ncbi:hypothetical protein FOZ61_005450 [Perkinsus olseni]|uniref:Uncharacterized protein n=1 Tax=Perkinsus olseni TaxID=32597 RepID=A0A7J6MKP9_PEROL|nr:hypothetical protein FOZ61_005450 [Perkinsus olseni]KAF4672064.1 hypothetical protein FOL46_009523 [Perkinsus olseni]
MCKEVNQVHEMTQWKQRVEGEMKSAQEWEDNWSFLVKKETRQASEVGQPTGASGGESSLNPIKSIGDATANDLERCKHMQRLPPKAKYFRPLTTQQELGWRPPIELFGTDLGHNIQRNDELWAD